MEEIFMKKTWIALLIIFLTFIWGTPAVCQRTKILANMSYKEIMDRVVRNYANKAAMFGPISWKSRYEAAAAYQKVVYYRSHEKELIREMAERNIERSSTGVHSYLEKRFIETLYSNEPRFAKL
jgi:hypothetical protein